MLAAIAITDAYSNDSPQFGPLVKKTAEGFTLNEITADMAYSSRNNLGTVKGVGGTDYIPYRKNATSKSKGSTGVRCFTTSSLTWMSLWNTTIREAILRQPTPR